MNYKKLFGFGVLIWAVVYLVVCIFVAYKAMNYPFAGVLVAFVAGLTTFFCARNLNLKFTIEALKYSVGWVIIGLILDVILTVPFTGWGIFTGLAYWLNYALIFLIPLSFPKKIS